MEEKNFAEKLAKDLKKKTIRKYVIGLLSIIIVVSLTLSLNIESKDSKLPDGQGNVITSQQDIDDNDNASSDGNTDSVPTDREDDSNKTQNVQSNKNPVSQENKKLSIYFAMHPSHVKAWFGCISLRNFRNVSK